MKKNLVRVLFSLCLAFSLVALFGALCGDSLLFDASASGAPSPSSGEATLYAVNLVQPGQGGTLEVNFPRAERGSRVTVTATVNENYTFASLSVTADSDNSPLEVTALGNGKYRFIMPKGSVTVRAELNWNNPYGDVDPDDPNRDGIEFASNSGLMNGTGGGNFRANDTFSRGQLVTVLWRLAGTPETTAEVAFPDVDPNGYYIHALAWASSTGLVSGYPDGTFGPEDPVSREQLAVFLYRRAAADGLDVTVSPAEIDAETGEALDPLADYADGESIALYAREAVTWAMEKGVLTARDGLVMPTRDCTRGEVATALYRIWG